MNTFDKNKLSQLILESLEGAITPDRLNELDRMLSENRQAVEYYTRWLTIYTLFEERGAVLFERDADDILECAFWKELVAQEKTAPAIDVFKEKPRQEISKDVSLPHPRHEQPVSRLNVALLLLSSAAILFMIVFAKLRPSISSVEVATLSDCLNAQWSNPGMAIQKGARISTADNLSLNQGLVALMFDNGARVILEAPVVCRILTEDRIRLTYGKLYAVVPPDATGFSVYTPNTKIIDLGTEFGVEINCYGDTQLSVLKGRTLLLTLGTDKVQTEVSEGTAKKVSGQTGKLSDIQCRSDYFVRDINSKANIAWRGQKTLDLADIVRQGNGLGTGDSRVHLNYLKGFTTDYRGGETLIANSYLPIKNHPFIDGIFIPNGRAVVSSQGHVFEEFLITSGVHCADLFGNPPADSIYLNGQWLTIRFNGQEYSEQGKSCIFMPGSNHGVTFDLDAIRESFNRKIDRFTAQVGLADFDAKRCNANFYVLVDGRPRFTLLGYTQKGVLNDVSIPIEDTDRFLTLATTENVDQRDYMAFSTLHDNWCVFAEPVLIFK